MIKLEKLIEEIAKELYLSIDYLVQIEYENKLESFVKSYFIETHLNQISSDFCHHVAEPSGDYQNDVPSIGINIKDFYIYVYGFEPKYITDRGFSAYFKIGDITIKMSEDDGFWKTTNYDLCIVPDTC